MKTEQTKIEMDGFDKVKPTSEGHAVKGDINSTSQIVMEPPASSPIQPSSSGNASSVSQESLETSAETERDGTPTRQDDPFAAFGEWNSPEDVEAYADL